jgi:hypothetical protein
MAEIWSHFSRSIDYYSYVVFSGAKQGEFETQGTRMGSAAWCVK